MAVGRQCIGCEDNHEAMESFKFVGTLALWCTLGILLQYSWVGLDLLLLLLQCAQVCMSYRLRWDDDIVKAFDYVSILHFDTDWLIFRCRWDQHGGHCAVCCVLGARQRSFLWASKSH